MSYKDKKYLISIEGNIGSGKTALLKYLKQFDEFECYEEEVEKWRNYKGYNLLDLMYQDKKTWEMTLQFYIALTFLNNHKKPQTKKYKIMDRTMFSGPKTIVKQSNDTDNMPKVQGLLLNDWIDYLAEMEKINIDLIIYLRSNPEDLVEQIKKRGRKEEENITLEYLQAVGEYHDMWLLKTRDPDDKFPPVLVLNIKFDNDGNNIPKYYDFIKQYILNLDSCDNTTRVTHLSVD